MPSFTIIACLLIFDTLFGWRNHTLALLEEEREYERRSTELADTRENKEGGTKEAVIENPSLGEVHK